MKKRRNLTLLIVFVCGGLLSAAGGLLAYHYETRAITAEFRRDASDRIAVIRRSLEMSTLLMEAMSGYFDSSEHVTREEFATFVEPYFESIHGIQALEWIPVVPAAEREAYERLLREGGSPDIEFREFTDSGELARAGPREIYFPVFYLEPLASNRDALGFDVGSNLERLNALLTARDENALVATGRIDLVQGFGNHTGFLLAKPVYRGVRDPGSREARAEALRGFVLGVFRPQEIVENALASLQARGIHLLLLDKSAPKERELLYFHNSRLSHIPTSSLDSLQEIANGGIQVADSFQMGGRRWSILCVPDETYIAGLRSWTPWLVLGGILLFTLMIARYLAKSLSETERVTRLARQRTQALELMKVRFELALKGADLGVWDWNVQSGEVYFNERWAAMLGYTIEEIAPHVDSWSHLLHPDDKGLVEEALQAHMAGETRTYKTEHRLKMKSGAWKWILDTGQVVEWDDVGKPLRAIGVHLDISEAKDNQEQLEKLSTTDQLTQVHNRMKLHDELHKEIERAARYRTPFSLIMIDIDHFKEINDTHGHDAGDLVLVELAKLVKESIRHVDLFARWGGEEFMIIAPNIGVRGAENIAEKLRLIVEHNTFGDMGKITCSFGVSEYTQGDDYDSLTKRADDALYEAKQTGRNRVVCSI